MSLRKAIDRWLPVGPRHPGQLGLSADNQELVRRLTKKARRTDGFIVYRLREAGWRQQVHPRERP